jgi:hypothetical protein
VESQEQHRSEHRHYYFRVHSPTQTDDDARRITETGRLRGRTPRFGAFPKVQAYRGPLPAATAGIEFTTETPPDPQSPPGQASWSGPRTGVQTFTDAQGVDWAQIEVTVTDVRWKEPR